MANCLCVCLCVRERKRGKHSEGNTSMNGCLMSCSSEQIMSETQPLSACHPGPGHSGVWRWIKIKFREVSQDGVV